MHLTDEEKRMLNGENGPGVQRAMDFLYQLGEGLEAERMIKVTSTHILPDMPTELLEQFTKNVIETPVMVSLMPCFDPIFWREHYGIVSMKEGNNPAAIICLQAEAILASAAITAGIPMVDKLDKNPFEYIKSGDYVRVDATNRTVEIEPK